MQEESSISSQMKFLVYIPCHDDFGQALIQAKELRDQFKNIDDLSLKQNFELTLVLSVNDYSPTVEQMEIANTLFNQVICYGSNFLADVNISQGFLVALQQKANIFWLLSTNDTLKPGALHLILTQFFYQPGLDLVAINGSGLDYSFFETGVINPPRSKFSYGVISGVVYNLRRISSYFSVGPFFPWTGWSQLAVIQSAMIGEGGLRIHTLPHNQIYIQSERSLPESGQAYAHSFYGMIILGFISEKKSKYARRFLRKYIFANFYNFHLFTRINPQNSNFVSKENYLLWNQTIAESIIKANTPISYLALKFFQNIPFEKLVRTKKLKKLKFYFDKRYRFN
jgi:hypothetical protein